MIAALNAGMNPTIERSGLSLWMVYIFTSLKQLFLFYILQIKYSIQKSNLLFKRQFIAMS